MKFLTSFIDASSDGLKVMLRLRRSGALVEAAGEAADPALDEGLV